MSTYCPINNSADMMSRGAYWHVLFSHIGGVGMHTKRYSVSMGGYHERLRSKSIG
jgi:hypothetical protein